MTVVYSGTKNPQESIQSYRFNHQLLYSTEFRTGNFRSWLKVMTYENAGHKILISQ